MLSQQNPLCLWQRPTENGLRHAAAATEQCVFTGCPNKRTFCSLHVRWHRALVCRHLGKLATSESIPVHIDTHSAFEDCIVVFNLGSQIVMEFHHPNGCHVPILLPRYSVLIMSKESRYLWSHGITPRKMDVIPNQNGLLKSVPRGVRTSFTFRIIRRKPCDCGKEYF
ncbi:alkylated DNA repair protein alkB homolog 8-like [Centruroides sculpturatus]|uniref:alkylated DNA repair protein alkB homolog 8-like n=1 Tax=Centruroides sculpturatus TaxID=218467 RepID=UPI000C6E0ED8|nr:alkylated DNA repair protein alkB homolog 8-like [Centruroides sculpturatus]